MKCFFSIFSVCFILASAINPLFAQSSIPNFAWAKQTVGTANNTGTDITTDALGNIYITGYFEGNLVLGTTTLTSISGSQDFYIAKFDPRGNVLWAKSAGGTGSDIGSKIATDQTGNIFIIGYFEGSISLGSINLTSSGQKDIFIAKYNSSGNISWAKKAGGIWDDYGRGIALDGNGNSYITGDFTGDATFENFTLNSGAGSDIFLAKYDALGNLTWVNKAGGPVSGTAYKVGFDIAIDGAGNSFITGEFTGNAYFGSSNLVSSGGSQDAFIAKFDQTGNVIWAKSAGGIYAERGTDVALDGAGNSYVTGYFNVYSSFGSIRINSSGNNDAFIAKYDTGGNVIWVKNIGGTGYDYGYSIKVSPLGSSYLVGAFQSNITIGSTTLSSSGAQDIFIVSYDNNGNVLWAKKAGGPNHDAGLGITIDNLGNSFITGFFQTNASFDSNTLSNGGTWDTFLSKIGTNSFNLIWNGNVSSAWDNPSNWNINTVPSASDIVLIPSGAPNDPIISTGNLNLQDITIASGASLTQTGGTSNITGSFTNNGTFFATGGTFSFLGTAQQTISGSGTNIFNNLTVGNSGVSLSAPVQVKQLLTLGGNLSTNNQTFTLLSDASSTAMVVNSGGAVNGTATVQRYISPSLNAGAGYRHYSSPVASTTFNDLTTAGFTPKINNAYNTLPTPGLSLLAFPNIFEYDQSRITATFPTFDTGWKSPISLSGTMQPGRGYDVQLNASSKVDFTGTLNNGTITLSNLGNGGQAESGWHLLGNPYPAPIDWNNITRPASMLDAVYTFRSTSAYSGSYASYVNGVGTLTGGVIPAMQGFFVKATANIPSFSFTNAARLTSYSNPSFYRTSETRPLLQLSLKDSQNRTDKTFVYQQPGATSGMDAAFDAYSLPMGQVRLYTLAGSEPLSVNGLALQAASQQVPLIVEGPSGAYQLKVEQLLNQFQASLEDKQLNTMQPLIAATLYAFNHSGGQSGNRFVLHLNARVNGMAKEEKSIELNLYPNPSQGQFQVQLSGVKASKVEMTINDLAGKTILHKEAKASSSSSISETIELKAAKGVYLLRVKADMQTINRKIVVE